MQATYLQRLLHTRASAFVYPALFRLEIPNEHCEAYLFQLALKCTCAEILHCIHFPTYSIKAIMLLVLKCRNACTSKRSRFCFYIKITDVGVRCNVQTLITDNLNRPVY